MKIRVIEPFRDVAFNNTITRVVDDIIDTTNPEFKCSEDLARERIRRGFAVEVKDDEIVEPKQEETKVKPKDNQKKGKKVSKKK